MTRSELKDLHLSFLGAGRIASVFIERLLASGEIAAVQIGAYDLLPEASAGLGERWGLHVLPSAREAIDFADVVFLAVPPKAVLPLVRESAGVFRERQWVVSLAAAVPLDLLEASIAAPVALARVIPNVPSLVGAGVNPYCLGRHVDPARREILGRLLAFFGESVEIDEARMNAAAALTAVGPTYLFPVLRALAEAANSCGLGEETALPFAARTLLGTARLVVDTGRHPSALAELVPMKPVDDRAVDALFGTAVKTTFENFGRMESAVRDAVVLPSR